MNTIKLKGVLKNPQFMWFGDFQRWAEKYNPNVKIEVGGTYRVSVAFKEGKRRKLKKKTIHVWDYTCDCCKGCPKLEIS